MFVKDEEIEIDGIGVDAIILKFTNGEKLVVSSISLGLEWLTILLKFTCLGN